MCLGLCSGSHGKAARQRELAMLGHLGGIFDELGIVKSLRSIVPYRISWSSVALHVCHEVVPRSQILYALNGNVVALCIADDKQVMVYIIPLQLTSVFDISATVFCFCFSTVLQVTLLPKS